jgi:hypothetical protein
MISRTLFITRNGSTREVSVRLKVPTEEDGYWECRFEIGWPEETKVSRARGFDGVQAIYAAMQNIAVQLYASPYHARSELHWGEQGAGYGFPMPVVGYDSLIGEDRVAQVQE